MRDNVDPPVVSVNQVVSPALITRALRYAVVGKALIDGIDLTLAPGAHDRDQGRQRGG